MIPRVNSIQRRLAVNGLIAATFAVIIASLPVQGSRAQQERVKAVAGCVTIGTPKPDRGYSYRQTQSGGGNSEFTDWWEEFTKTGSRLLTTPGRTKGQGILTVNRHRIVNDVLVLDSSSQSGPGAGGSSSYRPSVVSNLAFRACEGRSWPVPGVTVTNQSSQGTFSAMSEPGTLKIVSIHESINVPAGRFDTVHYVRNLNSRAGPQLNEYWTSIEHGVVVKRMHTIGGVVITATLQAIQ
jgi:hypothetical protein